MADGSICEVHFAHKGNQCHLKSIHFPRLWPFDSAMGRDNAGADLSPLFGFDGLIV